MCILEAADVLLSYHQVAALECSLIRGMSLFSIICVYVKIMFVFTYICAL